MSQKLKCVMLIDDDRSTNFLNEMVIREAECADKIVQAESGEEALAYLGTTESSMQCRPELIFLDINMPGMDGWEFIEAYRGLKAGNQHKPCVIMLTSSLNPEDEEKANEIGEICDYRHKPVTVEMIEDILEQKFEV